MEIQELEAVVRGEVRKAVADAMVANMAVAQEAGERAVKDGGSLADLAQRARAQDVMPRAVIENGHLRSDPHKGRGLSFARAVKALFVAALDKRSARDVAHDWSRQNADYGVIADGFDAHARALSQGDFSKGGSLIPPQFSSELIELLYPRTVALALGARVLEFAGSIGLGRINSGAVTYYVGEAQNITPSQPGTGELRLTGKKAAAVVAVSNEMMRNPNVTADAIVRDDLVQAIALRRDLSVLRGTGVSGQPKGIGGWINASNAFNSAGTTAANKVADLVKMIRLVDESNIDLGSGGFAMSPRSKWALYATLDANSNFIFAAQLAMGMLLGFPIKTTTQIPNNLGGGSDSEAYFGAWADLILGLDQATPLQVEVFPNGAFFDGTALVSGISSDQTPIRVLEGHDVALRHDNTFSKLNAIAWT